MVHFILCDDDNVFLQKLSQKLKNVLSQLNRASNICSVPSPEEITEAMCASCDVAILDIDYDGQSVNGIDLARKIRSFRKNAVIIFVTNFIEYAPEGYEVQAFRYLLKSNLEQDFSKYIQQALEQVDSLRESLQIQINGEVIDLPLENILFFEVQQHNITAHLQRSPLRKDLKTYSYYGSLTELEQKLEPRGFLRIHKSYLVNMKHLKKFQCREATLDNGMTLRVGEKSYAENKQKYLLWKGWQ